MLARIYMPAVARLQFLVIDKVHAVPAAAVILGSQSVILSACVGYFLGPPDGPGWCVTDYLILVKSP